MFVRKRYTTAEPSFDGLTGKPFHIYWVGGNTKLYGACLPAFGAVTSPSLRHHDGVSAAWPFTYDDLEPFYGQAEQLYQVPGQIGEDPTEPPRRRPCVPASGARTHHRTPGGLLPGAGSAPLSHVERDEPLDSRGSAR